MEFFWIAIAVLSAVILVGCEPKQVGDLSKSDSPIKLSITKDHWDQTETIFMKLRVNSASDASLLFSYVDQSIMRLEIVDSEGNTAFSTSKTAIKGYQRFLSKNTDGIFSNRFRVLMSESRLQGRSISFELG